MEYYEEQRLLEQRQKINDEFIDRLLSYENKRWEINDKYISQLRKVEYLRDEINNGYINKMNSLEEGRHANVVAENSKTSEIYCCNMLFTISQQLFSIKQEVAKGMYSKEEGLDLLQTILHEQESLFGMVGSISANFSNQTIIDNLKQGFSGFMDDYEATKKKYSSKENSDEQNLSNKEEKVEDTNKTEEEAVNGKSKVTSVNQTEIDKVKNDPANSELFDKDLGIVVEKEENSESSRNLHNEKV